MGKVYYVSKNVGLVGLALAATALVTIVALSIAYNNEKAKNLGNHGGEVSDTSTPVPPTIPFIPKDPWDHYRLPTSLIPASYNITLWPQLEPNADGVYTFTGRSAVVFRCVRATDLIIIHCHKLNLTSIRGHHAELSGLDGAAVPDVQRTWLVVRTEFLVVQLRGSLTAGASYVLQTEFGGELADDLKGFYRSEYAENGVKKVIATSQMQVTHARKAFPCFDEPAMKAIFNVTIIHSRDTTALSNGMQIYSENTLIDNKPVRVTVFEPTKRMSTYLLAFIVTDFSYNYLNQSNLLVRIWAQRIAIEQGHGDYALNLTEPVLHFYQKYYNTSYPLSKLDQIALPDFNAGAMENWGLVTYRDTALLFDPRLSSTGNKERVSTVISHELAHMWFGNLVTLRWWNDLWLNEGFATYVEYLGVDYAEPSWNVKDHIVLYEMQRAFAVDALASSHPLSRGEEEVNTPAEIAEMFNTISYSKGSAVLRMLSAFLTERVFVVGLSSYLKAFAFSNTDDSDLWDHLQQAVDRTPGLGIPLSVKDIMSRWTLQMGFPVVTIDTRTGNINQTHFLLDPDSIVERPSQFNYIWYIPVKWMRNGVEQKQYWLLQKTVSGQEWVLANTNVSGFFRVNYDQDNWDRLIDLLSTNHQALPAINRAQIIDDAFNLARAEIISTKLALRTTKYLSKERDYIPWQSALGNLNYFILMFDRTEVFGALQAYLRKQVRPLFKHFQMLTANWTIIPANHDDQYNQINAVKMACRVEVEGCRELIKGWYRQWMENPSHNPIHPNLRSTVYCHGVALGGVEEWDFTWRMCRNATLGSEAMKLRSALACSKTPWLLNRYLEYTLDPTKVRKQDASFTIQEISNNVVGMPLVWNFVRERWKILHKVRVAGGMQPTHLPSTESAEHDAWTQLRFCFFLSLQLVKFKKDNIRVGFGSATLALEQAIEKTTANIKWVTENKVEVLQWLTEEAT
uniref:Aminopeptidase n=1 Tax=Oryzias latipes TaxID=8090 RepID=A0A3P9I692_ORYLA